MDKYLPNLNDMIEARKNGATYRPESDLPGFGGVFNSMNLGVYSYSHNSPVIYTDPDGNRIDYNGYVLLNPKVVASLEQLNRAIISIYGKKDENFVIKVTGGDRFMDSTGKARSLTNLSVVMQKKNGKVTPAMTNSPHNIESGARGVDYVVSGITTDQLYEAAAFTDFSVTIGGYDDPHLHSQLPNAPSNRLQGKDKQRADVLKFLGQFFVDNPLPKGNPTGEERYKIIIKNVTGVDSNDR